MWNLYTYMEYSPVASFSSRRRPSPKATRTDAVRRQLEHDILNGLFPIGAHLDETALAERLGCSRTPVREAFNQLVAVGLLERRNHCGVYVLRREPGQSGEPEQAYGECEILGISMALAKLEGEERQSLAAAVLDGDPGVIARIIRLHLRRQQPGETAAA